MSKPEQAREGTTIARRGRRRDAEQNCEAFAVLEEIEGPLGPETFSVSFTEPRLTRRCRGRGSDQVTQWFVDGLPVASRSAADIAVLLPPHPDAVPPTPRPASPEDKEALNRFIRALAIANAREDHAREMAERAKAARPPDER